MEINKKYELLAPVGDMDMFEAAILANADAIYLAGDKFGARAYASNFDLEQLNNLTIKAHKHGIKVYLTVNTLIKDSEFKDLYDYLSEISKIGVDALIVQDLGVYYFIKKHFLDFEIHASTQMNVNNFYGAKYLQDLGFDRVVIGRESSLDELKEISSNLDIDVEFFVHGSLCVCVSGQCLISSLIGQRSGNRGRCAQPCRKIYDIYNKDGKKISQVPDTYISARDLMTIDKIKEIIDAGAYSLKIEGRMKKPEYVYTVVREYKKALEHKDYQKDKLSLVSNRKFTKGLFFGGFSNDFYNSKSDLSGLKVGHVANATKTQLLFEKDLYKGDVISVLTNKNKRLNLTLTKDYKKGEVKELKGYRDLLDKSIIYQIYSDRVNEDLKNQKNIEKTLDIDVDLYAHVGEKLSAKASALGTQIQVEIDYIVEKAIKNETDKKQIFKQLDRLGNSDYKLKGLKIDKDDNIFLAKSRLNELRRFLIGRLDQSFINSKVKIIKNYQPRKILDNKRYKNGRNVKSYKLTYEFFYDYNKNIDLTVFYRIYIHDLSFLKDLRSNFNGQIYFVMPRILEKKDYDNLIDQIDRNINLLDGFSASSLGDIEFLKRYDKNIHLEANLNVFNSYYLDFFRRQDINDISLSHELNHEEISKLDIRIDDDIEIQGYGKISQMILKHCPGSIIKNCKDDKNCKGCPYNRNLVLSNKYDTLIINRPNGYSEVLTDKSVDLINDKEKLDNTDIKMIRIVDGGEEEIKDVVQRYVKRFIKKEEFKYDRHTYTGHFDLGVM